MQFELGPWNEEEYFTALDFQVQPLNTHLHAHSHTKRKKKKTLNIVICP